MGQATVKVLKDPTRDTVKILGRKAPGGSAFDPATLALTLWLRDYGGGNWTGAASAGTSASHSVDSVGNDPSVGTLNGHNIAVLNGTTQNLVGTITWDQLITPTAATIVILAKSNIAPALGAWFNGPTVLTTPDQIFGTSFSDAGYSIGNYDAVDFSSLEVAATSGAYHLFQATHDGAQFRGRVDSGAYSTHAKGNTTSLDSETTAILGKSSAGSVYWDGVIVEVLLSDTVLSDTVLDKVKSYINSRYALSL